MFPFLYEQDKKQKKEPRKFEYLYVEEHMPKVEEKKKEEKETVIIIQL